MSVSGNYVWEHLGASRRKGCQQQLERRAQRSEGRSGGGGGNGGGTRRPRPLWQRWPLQSGQWYGTAMLHRPERVGAALCRHYTSHGCHHHVPSCHRAVVDVVPRAPYTVELVPRFSSPCRRRATAVPPCRRRSFSPHVGERLCALPTPRLRARSAGLCGASFRRKKILY